jgi:hypothetical protein
VIFHFRRWEEEVLPGHLFAVVAFEKLLPLLLTLTLTPQQDSEELQQQQQQAHQ